MGTSRSCLRVPPSFSRGYARVEFTVRNARLTDIDAAVRVLARADHWSGAGRDDADRLRSLLYVPAATVLVAEQAHRVVGVGVLSIRPSVRSGPFVGCIDELGATAGDDDWTGNDARDASLRTEIGRSVIEQLVASARNKGCSRVEVTDPLVSAEAPLLSAAGFAGQGTLLSRAIG